jgi:hypothetical protein
MYYVTVWRLRSATSYTYVDLSKHEALVLIDLVGSSAAYLIADATPELGVHIRRSIRTSWYTRDLPPEEN